MTAFRESAQEHRASESLNPPLTQYRLLDILPVLPEEEVVGEGEDEERRR
jgi:hypothetical protein